MGYFSSHNHTHFSNFRLLDATNRPKDLFERAIELGLTGFAVTDHEALSAHFEIMQYRDKLIKEGRIDDSFTVAFGDECYLVDEIGMGIKYPHWLLIAKDEKGHRILREISTTAWENFYFDRGMERVPVTKKQIEEIMDRNNGKGHLIATSACLGGELGSCALDIKAELEIPLGTPDESLILDKKQQMEDYVLWNKEIFGEDFYIELAPNDKEDQRFSNKMLSQVAKAYDIKTIFATDSHYLSLDDQDMHRAFLNSKEGEREVDEFYSTAYMMSLETVWEFMNLDFEKDYFMEMVSNLEGIRKQIKHFSLVREQEIPKVKVAVPSLSGAIDLKDVSERESIKTLLRSKDEQDLFWIRTCLNQLKVRDKWNDLYLDILNLEAGVIVSISNRLNQSMASYYNTARRLIEIMWDEGDTLVGTSRGSAMAFVSNWLLDITQIDPVPFSIPYWRHLSESRPELPDVDIDSQGFKRESVLEAMENYFGEDRVLTICTYGTEGTKSAIATACRGLGISDDISLFLSGMVPNERGFDWGIKDIVYGNKDKGRSPVGEFVSEINKHEGLLETAMSIEGMITSRSSHASGVYIFNHDYTEINASMKTPSGLRVTQWNMNESDEMGGLKFDFLSIEGLDKIRATMDLLIDDGLMDWQGSLKETYDKYIHPEVLDYGAEMWEPSWNGEVLDLFQFQTPVGGEAIRKGKPETVVEGAAINSLMRLMPMEDGTVPIDKFVKFKNDIQKWYDELDKYEIPLEEIKVLERHYLQSFGVPNTQEEMMILLMDKDVCGFSETDANMARKVVGKKQMEKIPALKEKIFTSAVCSEKTIQYIWDTAIGVQMGYSFSLPHTVAYTVIALQELNLYKKYPSIYWNTACLTVNSGSEDTSTDYAKIAVAIGNVQRHGITVSSVDINNSLENFSPDIKSNTIMYGMKPLSKISHDIIQEVIENRPYSDMKDFLERVSVNKSQMSSLIKSGSFDSIEGDRRLTMMKYAKTITNRRKQIDIRILPVLVKYDMLPKNLDESFRVFEFNKYLKAVCKSDGSSYLLDERAEKFYSTVFDTVHLSLDGDKILLPKLKWDKGLYQEHMNKVRTYLGENKDIIIEKLHLYETIDTFKDIGEGSVSKWEMDSMSFYKGEHELSGIDIKKYGIVKFGDLPSNHDEVRYKKGWRTYYETSTIIGTVLGKDKTKGSLHLLTPEGDVVLVKMYKGEYSYYDKQISEMMEGGKKRVIEKSWFQRGNKLFIHGFRRGEQFVPKTYYHSPFPKLGLISDITDEGELQIQIDRA